MKPTILTACITLTFCCQCSASDVKKPPLAEQCSKMLEQTNSNVTMTTLPGSRWVYYEGKFGQSLKQEGKKAIENLYASAFQEEQSKKTLTESQGENIPELTASGKIKASPEGLRKEAERENKAKAEFCQREIKELQKMQERSSTVSELAKQAMQTVKSSKSKDCLEYLNKWCDEKVKSPF